MPRLVVIDVAVFAKSDKALKQGVQRVKMLKHYEDAFHFNQVAMINSKLLRGIK